MTSASHVSRALRERGFVSMSSGTADDGAGRFMATASGDGTVFVFPADPILGLMLVEVLREVGYDADHVLGSTVLTVSGSPKRGPR